ncbi:unnamed protein product [Peniophora sp. CBMAI 1063]|nr:unnamed protein product [Peniophora sp. CBMAI 1063]
MVKPWKTGSCLPPALPFQPLPSSTYISLCLPWPPTPSRSKSSATRKSWLSIPFANGRQLALPWSAQHKTTLARCRRRRANAQVLQPQGLPPAHQSRAPELPPSPPLATISIDSSHSIPDLSIPCIVPSPVH